MRSNECYVYFGLSGAVMDPASISATLGLPPSKISFAGEKLPGGRLRKESLWKLEDRLPRDARIDFEARIKDVLDQLAPCMGPAAELSRQYHGTIMSVGYFHDYDPGFWLESDTVQRIANLGASVQCDFYHLIEEEPNKAPELTPGPVTPRATEGTPK
jgi:hypothetical protein